MIFAIVLDIHSATILSREHVKFIRVSIPTSLDDVQQFNLTTAFQLTQF